MLDKVVANALEVNHRLEAILVNGVITDVFVGRRCYPVERHPFHTFEDDVDAAIQNPERVVEVRFLKAN